MTNKVALVVGGTSGIGLATARVLIESGASVCVAGRDRAKGREAVSDLATGGGEATFVAVDVANATEVEALVAGVVARWGRIDWLVNAAAISDTPFVKTADITEADWDRTIAADLKGVWLCMKSAITAMQATGGSIVNVSSVNGLSGTPNAAAYCAAKHAIHGLSATAAMEYAAQKIRINVVCPGAHRTPMLGKVFANISPGNPAQGEAMMAAHIPMGRIGEPVECARAIAWLLSDAASYVTGSVMVVDGGMAA